ncbi:MAG: 2-aminoethylphosphonate ABC transporter substrate-binding protein [Janthinobacterium lividum]
MRQRWRTGSTMALACLLTLRAGPAWPAAKVVTLYSAGGLHDGSPSWYGSQLARFTRSTGIAVRYVEAGAGTIVNRVAKERANVQADVLVAMPPFMQKAANEGMLQPYVAAGADRIAAAGKDPRHRYTAMVYNYPCFVYNAAVLKTPPVSYQDLLAPTFRRKVQYSTPGQAGDGTALMLQLFHAFGGKPAGWRYLSRLEANNLGQSASTGKLAALVNKGELYVANGDLQTNLAQADDNPNIRVFFPAGPNGKRTTFQMPYYIGLVAHAPHADHGRRLIDFLLAAAAQREIGPVAHGLPARTDLHPGDAGVERQQALLRGVEMWLPDWDQVLRDFPSDLDGYRHAIESAS